MGKPTSPYAGLNNTSPNGTGMSGSRNVAEALKRARMSINPHAGFYDFSPTQYLPDEDMYGATDVVEQRLPSGPNYGPPGFGDPSIGTEYGAIPNRGRMMREIDQMIQGMPRQGGIGGGAKAPWDTSGTPANKYSPDGYGGTRGFGSGVTDPVPPPGAGPGYYGPAPLSGNNQWIPNNPLAPASTYGGLPGAGPSIYGGTPNQGSGGTVLDPVGVGAGPSMYGQPSNRQISGESLSTGQMQPSIYDPSTGTSTGQMDHSIYNPRIGMMDEIDAMMERGDLMSELDSMIPGEDYNTATDRNRYRGGAEDATRNDMGPLAGNLEMTPGEYDAVRNYKATEARNQQRRAKDAAAELAARYDLTDGQQKAQEEMYEEANKILRKQQIMTVLAAISGDPAHMQLAGQVAAISMARLENKYAPRMSKIQSQRMKDMMNAFNFNSKGEYDPPETQEEAMRALAAMGASKEESEALLGTLGDDKEEKWQNWRRGNDVRSTNTGMPPDDSGDWTLTGDTKRPASTADSGTGTKGAQAAELIKYERAIANAEELENYELADALRRDYAIKSSLYGLSEDIAAKDPTKTVTWLNNKLNKILANVTGKYDGVINWEDLSKPGPVGLNRPAPDGGPWTAEKFYDWFESTFTGALNNDVQQNPENGVQDGDTPTRDEVIAAVLKKKPDATEEEIRLTLIEYGYE